MPQIILPDRVLLTKPTVTEQPGSIEIFADGGVIVDGVQVVQILLFVCRRYGDQTEYREIGRIHMPRAGFDRSLALAASEFMPSMVN